MKISHLSFLPKHALLFMLCVLLTCCVSNRKENARMDRAESMMETAPDSAMTMLDSISLGSLSTKEDKARHALLKSMALDKNCIDTTTFAILQPAIDYYLKKGSPDDRLRTLYYQGRIYQNRKEDEEAMKCFIKATELKEQVRDSLTLARSYYIRALMYYSTYRYEAFVKNCMMAAQLFDEKGDSISRQLCLIKGIEGAVILENRSLADSILSIYNPIASLSNNWTTEFQHVLIIYADEFLADDEKIHILDSISKQSYNETVNLDLAMSYSNSGEHEKAIGQLRMGARDSINDPNKYNAIKAAVLHGIGKNEEAYESLLTYQHLRESEESELLSEDLLFIEKKYELEKANMKERENTRITRMNSIIIFLVLIILLMFFYIRLRSNELRRLKAEQKQRKLEEDNKKLSKEKDIISREKEDIIIEKNDIEKKKNDIERENVEIIREKNSIVEDNAMLSLQLNELISERDRMQKIMKGHTLLTPDTLELIKNRLKILDDLIASHISADEKSVKDSFTLLRKTTNDREQFLKSTRLLYNTLYPSVMVYLEDHGLTNQEMDFICLLALGLRGKEIGVFLQTSRHYHMSSSIRTKLGLSQNDTNLGLFILSMFK